MMTLFGGNGATTEGAERGATLALIRQGFVVGGGLMGGGSVVYGAFELMRAEPDRAFHLLEIWGPWFILALFSVWAANGLLQRGLTALERVGDRVCDSFDAVAVEQKRLADSQDQIAAAAQKQADKDDRDEERMSTLVEYSASQSRQALEMVTGLKTTMDKILAKLEEPK